MYSSTVRVVMMEEKINVPYALLDYPNQNAQITRKTVVHEKREPHLKVCVGLGCTGTAPVRSPLYPTINTNPTTNTTRAHRNPTPPRPNHKFVFLFFFCGWLGPPLLPKISNIFSLHSPRGALLTCMPFVWTHHMPY